MFKGSFDYDFDAEVKNRLYNSGQDPFGAIDKKITQVMTLEREVLKHGSKKLLLEIIGICSNQKKLNSKYVEQELRLLDLRSEIVNLKKQIENSSRTSRRISNRCDKAIQSVAMDKNKGIPELTKIRNSLWNFANELNQSSKRDKP